MGSNVNMCTLYIQLSALFCQQEHFHSNLSPGTCQKHSVFLACRQSTPSSHCPIRIVATLEGREIGDQTESIVTAQQPRTVPILILPCIPLCEMPSAHWQGGWYSCHWVTVSALSHWERCSLPPHLGRCT